MPEAVTRYIISPGKRMAEGEMDKAIKEVEDALVDQKIFTNFEKNWTDELKYFIHDEFDSKIVNDGAVEKSTSDEINKKYNQDKYNPIDGEIIRAADHLTAFLEAHITIKLGLKPKHMLLAVEEIREKYKNKIIGGINIGALYKKF